MTNLAGQLIDIAARLPGNVRGALWMITAACWFALMGVVVKALGQTLPVLQLAWLRAVVGLLTVLPFVAYLGLSSVRTDHIWQHFSRSGLGVLAMTANFYALAYLTLAEATAIAFARPLFIIALAVIFLGEIVRWRRWSATIVGFIGMLVMIRPDLGIEPAMAVAVFGVLFASGVVIVVKRMPPTETPTLIQFYFGVFLSLFLVVPGLAVWQSPSRQEWLLIPLMGLFGYAGQYCLVRALKVGEATAVMPFDYLRLLFAGVLGYVLFAEIPTLSTIVGAAIIIGSTFYIANREAKSDPPLRDPRASSDHGPS